MADVSAPWSDERIDHAIARELQIVDAFVAIGAALKTLPVESRERVIRAAAILHGIDFEGGRYPIVPPCGACQRCGIVIREGNICSVCVAALGGEPP